MLNTQQLQRFAELSQEIDKKTLELSKLNKEYMILEYIISMECMSAEIVGKFEIADLGSFKIKGGTDAVRWGILAQNREALLKKLFPKTEEQLAFAASQVNAKTVGGQLKEKLKRDFNMFDEVTMFFYHKIQFKSFKKGGEDIDRL